MPDYFLWNGAHKVRSRSFSLSSFYDLCVYMNAFPGNGFLNLGAGAFSAFTRVNRQERMVVMVEVEEGEMRDSLKHTQS